MNVCILLTLPVASPTDDAVFSTCARPEDGGGIKRIIMGLDRHQK